MKTLVLMVLASSILAPVAWAQVPQALRAADPSQQLKTLMSSNWAQRQFEDVAPVERAESLITTIDAVPKDANGLTAPAPVQPRRTKTATDREQRIRELLRKVRERHGR